MTIGIVDECRRYGLGSMLLNEVTKILNQNHTACEAIYLHVVDYNEAAIRFYEKNNFSTLKRIKNHYVIFEKNYDALLLYKDIKLSNRITTLYDNEKLKENEPEI
jgi:ribosomal protein S18 acetylase RimI-like enzyme